MRQSHFLVFRAVWESGAQGRRLSYLRHIIEDYFPDVHYIESSDEDSDTDSMPSLEEIQ